MWALNFVWMIVIGMMITIMVFLIAYRPQDLLGAIAKAIEVTPGILRKILYLCRQIKKVWNMSRNWRGRMYSYKALRATSIWGICLFLTLCSWAIGIYFIGILCGVDLKIPLFILVALIVLQRCLAHWNDLSLYVPNLILENRLYGTDGTYTVVYVNLYRFDKKEVQKRAYFKIRTSQQSLTSLFPGVIDDSNQIVNQHDWKTPSSRARVLFCRICSHQVTTGWKMFLKYNAPNVIAGLVITFFKGMYLWIVEDLKEFMYELMRLFLHIHWELNTTARRAIFTCSVVGFFSGCIAELLGAHAAAPYWCFATGFVFGFFQNYVFKCLQRHISIFLNIQMPEMV